MVDQFLMVLAFGCFGLEAIGVQLTTRVHLQPLGLALCVATYFL